MESSVTPRVVPSGKVYRQKFEAEVQLVKALELSTNKRNTKAKGDCSEENNEASNKIPVVRESYDVTGSGILTDRQKTWTEGFPNEPDIENPVVYKQYLDDIRGGQKEPENNVASKEVRGLPDILTPGKTGSNIIERIAESRKQRHEATVEDMHQELGIISTELEPQIQEGGDMLLIHLAEDDQEIDITTSAIQTDQDLVLHNEDQLLELWNKVAEHSISRQTAINQLDKTLTSVEEDRMQMVRDVMHNYAKQLEKIAHLMKPDLQKLLDKESQGGTGDFESITANNLSGVAEQFATQLGATATHRMVQQLLAINQTVLANRRAYADLYTRLMTADIEREKRLHTEWKKRVEDWKTLHIDNTVNQFKSFMQSDRIVSPPGANNLQQLMFAEQRQLNQRRLDLVEALRDMKPPASTKTMVYQWNDKVIEISKQIDGMSQQYFTKLYSEYESVCQDCLDEVERIKCGDRLYTSESDVYRRQILKYKDGPRTERVDLVTRGVCTEDKAKSVVENQCLPLVGQAQQDFEKNLETMDRDLEKHNATVLSELKSLFRFTQGAAHVWDIHELGLARQERSLQEKLDTCRHKHDVENQDREANLDIQMDRMRQDATEQSLKDSLKKSLEMLDKIKDSYNDFHQAQTHIVCGYPGMVAEEVECYDKSVCKFFSVDRRHPDDKEKTDDDLESQQNTTRTPSPQSKPAGKGKKKGKRPGSRASSKTEERKSLSPLPLAVAEVLSTAKGTAFYVLTVAGDHGIPPESDAPASDGKTEDRTSPDQTAFLTEVEVKEKDEEKPVYIQSVDVADSVILQVKKAIRLNFIEHMEEWGEHAIERSQAVVSAKKEELNNELDLRFHLHDPRPRRAEMDVHNVRAAELVMHSERVTRHCKGINQNLTDLKTRFTEMTEEHDRLAEKFREDIQALEIVFINATKSSKLVALSNQLQTEQDKYMDIIRASLRSFRQELDNTLQMLRQSNARFIKSFKLFSDGGNFCPEEIEEYRKRLEKMAQKIDSAEGFILADLEGMESKRLDQASKTSAQFEDRFKHHMIDLLFMEKVARWLTNTQVKVKAEVAESNTQAKKLAHHLKELHRRIDACEKPNLDKETVTPTQLNESLKQIFEAVHTRSFYLNCIDKSELLPPSGALRGNPALGSRVGFVGITMKSEGVPPISKAGKQPSEDPTVGVIKSILKTQKNRMKFGTDASLLETTTQPGQNQVTNQATLSAPPPDSREKSREKAKSRMSDVETRSKKSSKPGTASNSQTETPKRVQSGRHSSSAPVHLDRSLSSMSISSLNWGTVLTLLSKQRRPGLLRSKANKIDKKYYIFGEAPEEGENNHFLGRIKHIQREALDGLLTASEMYYRQKGNRAVTRPQALQETFELCADVLVQKLQSYFTQADDYHNQCLQELRSQLVQLEDLMERVPGCMIKEILRSAIDQAQLERAKLDQQFCQQQQEWDVIKTRHKQDLRPTLGHPQQSERLSELCETEEERHQACLAGVTTHAQSLCSTATTAASIFIQQLARATEQLLLQFDQVLTVDDLEKGRVAAVKYPTAELIRRKQAGQPLEDDPDKDKLPRGQKSWPGIPTDELVVPSEEPKEEKRRPARGSRTKPVDNNTASVTTARTTLSHTAAVRARNLAYEEYKRYFQLELKSIEEERAKQQLAEERWTDNWVMSVDRVRQLY